MPTRVESAEAGRTTGDVKGLSPEGRIFEAVTKAMKDPRTLITFSEYMRNAKWFEENLRNLKRGYAGMIVVILNGQVVFGARKMETLQRKLQQLGERMNECFTHYIPKKDQIIMPG